jgi:hypothetical protein
LELITEGHQRGVPRRRLDEVGGEAQHLIDEIQNPIDEEDYDYNCDDEERYDGPRYHPGGLEADSSKFCDWNPACGPISSNYVKREYPENFVWTCCSDSGGRQLGWGGCKKGYGESIIQKYPPSPKRDENEIRHMELEPGFDFVQLFDDESHGKFDYDEEKHGNLDTRFHGSHFPTYYKWGCCGKSLADDSGCVIDSDEEEEEEEDEVYFYSR